MTIPGMSVAGRGFTSYVSNSTLNNNMKKELNITDNIEYKDYIQKNGETMSSTLKTNSDKRVVLEQWWTK
jgi:hypothetical protein